MRNISLPGAVRYWLLGLLAWISYAPPAFALGDTCSVSGATLISIGNYNPFSGSGFTQVPVILNLTRYRSGNAVTGKVNFYFVQPAGSPAYANSYLNSNVLYTLPATHSLSLTGNHSGTVYYDFGGRFNPDTVPILLTVTIPGNLNLVAGDPIVFDIRYICDGANGMKAQTSPATLTNAMTIKINVLSALQASYVGAALDFGEVGIITDVEAPTHSVSGALRVASSGPYTVNLSASNDYRMTYPGGNLGTSTQTIKYSTRFLGQTKSNAFPTFTVVACSRAGTSGQNLPITVTLQEGGLTKVPAPDYLDTLTVTVTPLAVPHGGTTVNCPSL